MDKLIKLKVLKHNRNQQDIHYQHKILKKIILLVILNLK
jgi:hypothetical protein